MTAADAPQEFDLAAPTPTEPTLRPDLRVSPALLAPVKPERLVSLDVFRGITIAAMLLVNNPGPGGRVYAPLGHAEWHGWTPTDFIFPFFLFIVGVAIPFSFAKRSTGESRGSIFLHIWARALSLVTLGLLLHSIPWLNFQHVSVDGYSVLSVLRWMTYVVVGVGLIVLLVPWRSRKMSLLLPPIVAVVLLVLGLAMHYAIRRAIGNGLSADYAFGNGLFKPSHLRFPGILQRIGICYGVAASIALFSGWRTVLLSLIVLCAGYSALMLRAPDRETARDSLTMEDNFARRVDERVFNRSMTTPDGRTIKLAVHTYDKYPDPEGIVSTLPAIGSTLLGILVGYSLRHPTQTHAEKCARLLANGVLVSIVGVLLSWWLMPINKPIWTPSFTFFTGGMGMLTLGAVFYFTDVKGRRAWAWPFKVYGMNAVAAFVFTGIIVRVAALIQFNDPATGKTVTLASFCKRHAAEAVHRAGDWWAHALPYLPPIDTPGNVALAFPIGLVFVVFLILALMYAFKIFLKV